MKLTLSLKSKLLGFAVSTGRWMHFRAFVVGGRGTRTTFSKHLFFQGFVKESRRLSLLIMAPKFFLEVMRVPFWPSVSSSASPSSIGDHFF